MSQRTKVLGVDLGMARTGLAVSDALGISTRALQNLDSKSRADAMELLLSICEDEDVGTIVIGLPKKPKSGDEGPIAVRARGLVHALEALVADRGLLIQVRLWDESESSKIALERLVQSGTPKQKRKQLLDGEAARVIVEDYLAAHPIAGTP